MGTSRNRAWRKHHEERIVKKRINKDPYPNRYSPTRRGWWRKHAYYLRDPENKWFNYFGDDYKRFKTSSSTSYHYRLSNEIWKSKYMSNRARLKEVIRKELNDEIGERYHIRY